jgi:HPr kinase/phosphorylase
LSGRQTGEELFVHGTCVAINCSDNIARAALLRGAPGSGKSDLALRFIAFFGAGKSSREQASLISDDQVLLTREGDVLDARAPGAIAGKLEVRGLGIVEVNHLAHAQLTMIIDLVGADEVPRMPDDPPPSEELLGVSLPMFKLDPFEHSSSMKLKLRLTGSL